MDKSALRTGNSIQLSKIQESLLIKNNSKSEYYNLFLSQIARLPIDSRVFYVNYTSEEDQSYLSIIGCLLNTKYDTKHYIYNIILTTSYDRGIFMNSTLKKENLGCKKFCLRLEC